MHRFALGPFYPDFLQLQLTLADMPWLSVSEGHREVFTRELVP